MYMNATPRTICDLASVQNTSAVLKATRSTSAGDLAMFFFSMAKARKDVPKSFIQFDLTWDSNPRKKM